MIADTTITISPSVVAVAGLIGTLVGAYVSARLLRPRQKQILAAAESATTEAADRIIGRYKEIVERLDKIVGDQEGEIERCHARLQDLEQRERACEERNNALARDNEKMRQRVAHVIQALHRHGINGDLELEEP